MSMFRSSAELRDQVTYKIFCWGPEGGGKSHFLHSAPDVAVIDAEHRSGHFRDLFTFKEVAPSSFREAVLAVAEIAKGSVPCKSIGLDGMSKLYEALVRRFTTTERSQAGKEYATTDWPAVNRGMLEILDPLFAISDKHTICTAKQVTKLTRKGRDFERDGVKFIGDVQRWPYYFDFCLHFATRGAIYVEKSMSTFLPVGSNIQGDLDWTRFMALVRGEEKLDARPLRSAPAPRPAVAQRPAPEPAAADGGTAAGVATAPAGDILDQDMGHHGSAEPTLVDQMLANVSDADTRRINAFAKSRKLDGPRLVLLIAKVEQAPGTPLHPDHVEALMDEIKAEVVAA